MKDSKIVEILKTLSPEEFRELEKFVQIPYFRKRDVGKLFLALKNFYPDFQNKNLTNRFIFGKLFPDSKFDEKKSDSLLRTLASDLFIVCKEFLIQIELKEQDCFRNYFLLNQLRKRNLDKEFHRESSHLVPRKDSVRVNMKQELVVSFLEYFFLQNAFLAFHIDKGNLKEAYEALITQSEYLATAALLRSLKFSDQKNAAESGYNLPTRYNLVENFMEHVDTKGLINVMKKNDDIFATYIEFYFNSHQMITDPMNEKNYFAQKKLLEENSDILSQSEKYMLYSICKSFCTELIENGFSKYKQEVFELNENMLKQNAYKYSQTDYFNIGNFRNMLIEARVVRKFEWMKNLIDNYSSELHPDYRENMRHYSMGQYLFSIGENEKALENLVKLKTDYFLYKKDLKNLLFRIYYNLGFYEEAYSILDNLRHYLSSTKDLSGKIKSRANNFVKYATELLRLKTGTKKENPDYLYKKITDEQNIESIDWLLEKIKELG